MTINATSLPNELLIELFNYLTDPADLSRVGHVCRQWKEVADTENLWQNLVKASPFKNEVKPSVDMTWKKWMIIHLAPLEKGMAFSFFLMENAPLLSHALSVEHRVYLAAIDGNLYGWTREKLCYQFLPKTCYAAGHRLVHMAYYKEKAKLILQDTARDRHILDPDLTERGIEKVVENAPLPPTKRENISISSDGKKVVVNQTTTYSLTTCKENDAPALDERITCALSVKNRFVTGSSDGTLRLWETKKQHCIRTIRLYKHPISSINMLDDTRWVIGLKERGTHILEFSATPPPLPKA